MGFAIGSLFLLYGISGLLTGVWSFPLNHWKNIKCPAGWTQLDCHCYIYETTAASFVAAETDCIGRGGNLASIHSDLENRLVLEVGREGGTTTQFWIGLHDAILEGDYIWTDGSLQNFLNFDVNGMPAPEPNTNNGNCVELDESDGLWQTASCTASNTYVCIIDVCNGGDPNSPDPSSQSI
ncbi:galactose-specific lectin nattectin-like [Phycodurus eques]|uniref:galactose-specific lectin nattectin-like n=1 Tax=Phycodurus eques TaxID=693459 RepID=UPI002ACD59ED|nr:galactose-specific lectin nattectin-like [Phycodurus eques]XP_061533681.1 galactose-specific lectin nattectin-like [Phycodurus eques]XP_061533682.1 galactose-specific lectin nattectin-like [Phycodurus eques]XP_061533683.1 galactose-specific lectin nattectin-like [Phycodurus eques]